MLIVNAMAGIRTVDGTDFSLYSNKHPSYVNLNGTTPMSANWDIGAFQLTAANFVSDIAIGTAPYACTSTTLNTNLNADLLDGSHASAFAIADAGLTSLAGLTYVSTSFVKMTGADTFSLDTSTYYKSGDSPTFAVVTLSDKVTTYNNIATEGYGVPAIVDQVSLTGQTADITATNCTNAGTAGHYRVSYYLQATTVDATAGAVFLLFNFTDDVGATSVTSAAIYLDGVNPRRQSGVIYIRLASGNLTYSTSHTGIFGTADFRVDFTVERLN